MISEIFMTSLDGRLLARKKYKSDIPNDIVEAFVGQVRQHKTGSLPPVWRDGATHVCHIKRSGLYLAAATVSEMRALYVTQLLTRLYQLLRDFCGTLSEEALHVNLVLVYEVLDEFMDYGEVQIVATEKMKPYIQSEAVPVRPELSPDNYAPSLFGIDQRTAPGNAADKPVIQSRWDKEVRKNEIFLDVIERMTVLIGSNDSVLRSEVVGQLNMKSFLNGSPQIKLGLNEDLVVGRDQRHKGYGNNSRVDECQFNACVDRQDFNNSRMLVVRPPEGEVALMSYCLQGDLPHSLPFRIYSRFDETDRDLGVNLRLRCDIPTNTCAVNVKVNLPLPKNVTSVSQQLSGSEQTIEFSAAEKKLTWTIKKLYGKSEVNAQLKLISVSEDRASSKDVGPAALEFEISGFVCSNLQIRFLRVFDTENSYVPQRWVRYITTTDSYIIKL